MNFSGKKVAIIGLGIEGKDALRFLNSKGARLTVFDQKVRRELNLSGVEDINFELVDGPRYLDHGLTNFEIIVRSPGVRPDIPQIEEAVRSGAELSSAIKLFFSLCPAPIIGVTGTKGKGTTATLVYECLVTSGRSTYLAGNIGVPYLELLPKLTKSDLVVLELSSFQLIDIEKSPHIAMVVNITTDHLDWHKNREEYVRAKENIVRFQTKDDFAVLMRDYDTPASFAGKTKSKVLWASIQGEVEGAYVSDGKIFLNVPARNAASIASAGGDQVVQVGKVDKLLLRGKHNWENVATAIAAARLAGATLVGIRKAIFSFKGLPHRLELVGTYNGITFYNDSFATSPTPVLAAVDSFTEPVILILGGSSKGLSYEEFGKELANRKHVKAVLIIGEVGPEIEESLRNANFSGKIVAGGKSMGEIVKTTVSHAAWGDVVLLSPATASFDMFKDYKDRGDQFKEEVRKLETIV